MAALLLLCGATGCSTWRATTVPAATATGATAPRPVRFVRADGDTVILERPLVVGDSLVGWQGRRRVATALTDVQQLETARVDVRRTLKGALRVYGVIFVVSGLLFAYLMTSS